MLILFCFVVKLDSPTEIPAKEIAFYAYMLVRKYTRLVVFTRKPVFLFLYASLTHAGLQPIVMSKVLYFVYTNVAKTQQT